VFVDNPNLSKINSQKGNYKKGKKGERKRFSAHVLMTITDLSVWCKGMM
jgi:hypothetical protein